MALGLDRGDSAVVGLQKWSRGPLVRARAFQSFQHRPDPRDGRGREQKGHTPSLFFSRSVNNGGTARHKGDGAMHATVKPRSTSVFDDLGRARPRPQPRSMDRHVRNPCRTEWRAPPSSASSRPCSGPSQQVDHILLDEPIGPPDHITTGHQEGVSGAPSKQVDHVRSLKTPLHPTRGPMHTGPTLFTRSTQNTQNPWQQPLKRIA